MQQNQIQREQKGLQWKLKVGHLSTTQLPSPGATIGISVWIVYAVKNCVSSPLHTHTFLFCKNLN